MGNWKQLHRYFCSVFIVLNVAFGALGLWQGHSPLLSALNLAVAIALLCLLEERGS